MKDIRIDVGVCTVLDIDLSKTDFKGIQKIIFTVKNYPSVKAKAIIEREFTEAKKHQIIIKPDESIKLEENAVYDFDKVLTSGTRLKMTDNGKVNLRKAVGDCIND